MRLLLALVAIAACNAERPAPEKQANPSKDPWDVPAGSATPVPNWAQQDYAEARSHFQTTLIRHEPSWQRQAEPTPPAGVRKVAYTSDGLTLTAWLEEFSGSDLHPAVLFLHGGFAFDTPDWEMSQPLREAGFVVMTPILRGEDGMPGDYSLYYNELEDVLAAADLLAKTPGIDPNRIYVAGHSAGGTLAMLAAMASHRFRAAASFSGVADQRPWAIGQEQRVPFDRANDIEFRMRSPIDFASSFHCPTRLYYGDKEPFFRKSMPRLAALAAAAGLDVVSTQVAGNHMTMVPPAVAQAIEFFRTH